MTVREAQKGLFFQPQNLDAIDHVEQFHHQTCQGPDPGFKHRCQWKNRGGFEGIHTTANTVIGATTHSKPSVESIMQLSKAELIFHEDLFTKQYPLEVMDKACFTLEARMRDGQFYPGATLKNILSALFRVYKQNVGANNVVESSSRFLPTCTILISECFVATVLGLKLQLLQQKMKHNSGLQALSVLFYNGKHFCLRSPGTDFHNKRAKLLK